MIDLIIKGGPVMVVLLICSLLSLAIILERLVNLKSSKVILIDQLMEIEMAIKNNDIPGALDRSQKNQSPMMKIAEVALINSDKPKDELKTSLEEIGRLEVPILEKYLSILHTIAVISPLLGLLGTVTGMIKVFETIVEEGAGQAELLAGGISEALITTATGLTIAIPTLIFYNIFAKKVDNMILEMERHSLTLYELLIGDHSTSKG